MMLTVYSKNNCSFCEQAKNFLKMKNINFREVNIDTDDDSRRFIMEQGHRTVPQIYFNNKIFVAGGYQGLSKMTTEQILDEIELRSSLLNQSL